MFGKFEELNLPELEKEILAFWKKKEIFEKSLEKTKNGEPFTFYDGPPFATGLPHYGHILASTIKDVIPRFQTMRGRFVRRHWGWDCHGLPIEEIVERKLGISGKKQIEEIGIQKFNETCRSTVLQYAEEWGKMVERMGRWVEFDNAYKTMDRDYMESVWWAFKQIYDKGLVYEGRKVLLYCPRCETPVSNFEVAMDNSYQDVTEEAVTIKFKLEPTKTADSGSVTRIGNYETKSPVFLLAWTTTPWTLPGNIALAVGENIEYALREREGEAVIYGKDSSWGKLGSEKVFYGRDLVGLKYEPLFDVPATKSDKSYKVYAADFVNTEEGTGIVHTAVVYGEDDYALGVKVGLPVVPLLDEKGNFNEKAPEFIRGKYFKDAEKVIKNHLKTRRLFFAAETHTHSYPHCWRCQTALFYNAIPAWFINVQKIKGGLLDSNAREINWYPAHLKQGRYAKSVEAAPDWNISRNRYWGNPIPVWKCKNATCPPIVIGSIKELGFSTNTFYFSRHGEARQNVLGIESSYPEKEIYDLTDAGLEQTKKLIKQIKNKGGIDLIFASDLLRTKHTAEIIGKELNVPVSFDKRLREYNLGELNGRPAKHYDAEFPEDSVKWTKAPKGGETWAQIQARMINFIKETDKKHQGKKILVVSHGDPLWLVQKYYGSELGYPEYAQLFEISVGIDDLHRPGIDKTVLKCPNCGGEARRVKEIFDSWVEAGSMPFAEYHYPFDQKEIFESRLPAQFVAEYIAQTRAWFYVMHVIGHTLFGKAPFENVVATGTILAAGGSKMSKSKNNYPDPWVVIEKYGIDSLRFYLMNSVVMQADNLNFSVKDLENIFRKIPAILWNVYKYLVTYAAEIGWQVSKNAKESVDVLDCWIDARTKELINKTTAHFENYDTVRATRAMEEYIDDLSVWYLRRSRGRKDNNFFVSLANALGACAKVIAPVMPFIAEAIYLNLAENKWIAEAAESVHLAAWPEKRELSAEEEKLLEEMAIIREAASVGLAARKKLNIPVRQPLSKLALKIKISDAGLAPGLLDILLGELNIKGNDQSLLEKESENVKVFSGAKYIQNLYIDVAVDEALKIEGLTRGLERLIQEKRKKEKFKVGDMAILTFSTEDGELKEAMRLLNRQKTYLSDVQEAAESISGEFAELEGKKIFLNISRG